MRIEEARWINQAIERQISQAAAEGSYVINLGSGTAASRELGKPYIHQLTIAPLLTRGYQVIHSDMFSAEGVDLVGDLFDPQFQKTLASLKPAIVMFCNILEHLSREQRGQVPEIIRSILAPGGHVIVTVPNSYPYHADPIDTLYRPGPNELARLFSGFTMLESDVVSCGTYTEEFLSGSFTKKVSKVLRIFFPFVRPKRWLSHTHRMLWIFRKYKITAAIFRI
jgi:hypothetical protein